MLERAQGVPPPASANPDSPQGVMPGTSRIPRLASEPRAAQLRLSPAEGFLLSRIDGSTPWETLCEIGGLAPGEVDRCLTRWLDQGILSLATAPDAEDAPVPDGAMDVSLVDTSLDLALELQREILDFEKRLDQPYHELLGVPRDADSRSIKRAYFQLSKRFHPDRYYRKRVGHFGARLTRIFKKLVVASELLSDPVTRVELLRSLAQSDPRGGAPDAAAPVEAAALRREGAVAQEPASGPEPGPAERERARKLALLERVRKQVRIPDKLLAERRFRASQLFEAGMHSAHAGRPIEGAASIRLAIAFDPWSDAYKEGLAEVQAEVHRLRAEELMAEASASWDDSTRSQALHLYEEALHYRPGDAQIHERAALAALSLGELEKAFEYAARACELLPESPECLVALARVQIEQEQHDAARRTLDQARRLAPRHEAVRAAQEALLSAKKGSRARR